MKRFMYMGGGAIGGVWTPSDSPNIHEWWDFADPNSITDSGGGFASSIVGQTLGYNLAQANVPAQPQIDGELQNGIGGFLFDGTDDFLQYDNFVTPSSVSFIIGARSYAGSSGDPFFRLNGSPDMIMTNGKQNAVRGNVTSSGHATLFFQPFASDSSGLYCIWSLSYDADTDLLQIFLDGELKDSLSNYTSGYGSGFLRVARSYSVYINMFIGEMIWLNTGLPEERQKCEGYIAHRRGLTDNLPPGHPYKDNPP